MTPSFYITQDGIPSLSRSAAGEPLGARKGFTLNTESKVGIFHARLHRI